MDCKAQKAEVRCTRAELREGCIAGLVSTRLGQSKGILAQRLRAVTLLLSG